MKPPVPPDPGGPLVPRRPQPEPAPAPEPAYGYGYGPDYADEQASGSLLDYWRILMRRKGTLILITFLGALLALLATLPQTPIYQARATLEIQGLNEDFMNLRDVSPVQETGPSFTREAIDTQVQILKSETLLERTLKKLGWEARPANLSTAAGRPSAWRRALGLPEPAPEDARRDALEMARENLKVRVQGQTRIVEILVDSTDAQLAAAFANTLASEFIDQNLEARWAMTQRTGEWLSRQLEEMRIKLERSEDRLQAYARQSGLMFTEKQGSVAEDKLGQLQAALSAAQADRIAKQSRFELVRTSPPEALPDVLNDASLREYQVKLTGLRQEHSQLFTTFTAEHPQVKRVQAQIDTLEGALQRERAAVIQRIRNDYEEAVRREKLLELDYTKQSRLVSEQSEKAIQYNILKREVDSNRQIYDAMLERVRSASVASALRASNVRVVDAARAPEFPYKPRVALNTLLGLMLGGFLGVVFIVMRERMDRALQEPGDAQFYLNVAELGVIPSGVHHRKLLHRAAPDAAPVETAVAVQKHSMLAESFRAVLTSILFSSQNGNRPRVIVLTSPSPGEGKSTIAANLGEALAEVNKRVLLIDGDLRKPRLHDIFETGKEHGLSEVLQETCPLPESMNGAVRETRVANLFLLPSGAESAASTNLLYSERMAALLELFEKEFDTVLIDTPPMMQVPDARILGRLADAVILVLRAGRTTRDAAQAARARLAEDGTTVLGAILNDWDPKRAGASRYGYYYDRYRYYHRYGE